MKKEQDIKPIDFKKYIVLLIAVAIVFLVLGYSVIRIANNHYFEQVQELSANLARGYVSSIQKAYQADRVVNDLLEDKILIASQATGIYTAVNSHRALVDAARVLQVDEINIYNKEAELLYSSTPSVRGFVSYEGHPVYEFSKRSDTSYVEPIRANVVTGVLYKYGYFKMDDGKIVQIGVAADKVNEFLNEFRMSKLIAEIYSDIEVEHVLFMNEEYRIVESTNQRDIGVTISDPDMISLIESNYKKGKTTVINTSSEHTDYTISRADGNTDETVYGYGRLNKGTHYLFVPVTIETERIGTLVIGHSLVGNQTFTSQFIMISITALIIIFALIIYAFSMTYNKDKRLINMAYYDKLTGLPNAEYFTGFIGNDLKNFSDKKRAVLLANCSNFRIINMTYGYNQGDLILKEVARMLKDLCNEKIKVFRFAADRFIFYAKDYKDQEELVILAGKICQKFDEPFPINEVNKYISIEIGILEITEKYKTASQLLKDVLISISHVEKIKNNCRFTFFDSQMEEKIKREEIIESELRMVIKKRDSKKLFLNYQPQLELENNTIVGFEALARFNSDTYGLISPLEFIDIAEKNQLIIPLGNMILRQACLFSAQLDKKGYKNLKMAVNISGAQLIDEDFARTVLKIAQDSNMQISNLELEITESILLDDFGIINSRLEELAKNNIKIALDDFGTGYSSFFRLKELNVHNLKIDRYFISRINNKNKDDLVSGEIINFAHKLNLKVVAEGVENQEQKQYLIDHNCDIMQGYLFSRPLKEDDAMKLLKDKS